MYSNQLEATCSMVELGGLSLRLDEHDCIHYIISHPKLFRAEIRTQLQTYRQLTSSNTRYELAAEVAKQLTEEELDALITYRVIQCGTENAGDDGKGNEYTNYWPAMIANSCPAQVEFEQWATRRLGTYVRGVKTEEAFQYEGRGGDRITCWRIIIEP